MDGSSYGLPARCGAERVCQPVPVFSLRCEKGLEIWRHGSLTIRPLVGFTGYVPHSRIQRDAAPWMSASILEWTLWHRYSFGGHNSVKGFNSQRLAAKETD